MSVTSKGRAILGATTVVLGLLAGCGGQDGQDTSSVSLPVQKSLSYELLTHCGIRWASFEGKRWITPFLGDRRTGSAPEGWDNPFQEGEMQLIGEGLAVFTSDGHEPLIFRTTQRRWPEPGCA